MRRFGLARLCIALPAAQIDGGDPVDKGVEQVKRRVDKGVDLEEPSGEHGVGFMINSFNTWKKTAVAGRMFVVDSAGATAIVVTAQS